MDYFPTDKLTVNMFLMAYDEGLLSKFESVTAIDDFMFRNYNNVLLANYGVTDETARGIIKLVAGVLNKPMQESEAAVDTVVLSSDNKTPAKPVLPKTASSVEDFRYASNGSEVRINKYMGKGGKVVIPDYIDGLPVTRIAENAFYAYSSKGAERITEIQLPSQLEYIGSGAFQSIENLTGVLVLPPTLKEVESHAFQSTNLKGLVIQSNSNLELNSFANIYGMEFIYVAKGCAPVIDTSVFSYAEALKDLVLPEEITDIAEETFDGCNEVVLYAPKGSYADKYGKKNFINVNSEQYEKISNYYKMIYKTI